VEEAGLPLNEIATFLASLFVNLAVAVLLLMVLGGRDLLRRAEVTERPGGDAAEPAGAAAGDGRTAPGEGGRVLASSPQQRAQAYGDAEMEARSEERELERSPQEAPGAAPDGPLPLRAYQLLTVAGILILAALTLFFEVDIGFAAITIGLVLTLIAPQLQKGAVGQVPWPEILLITGVGTYVGVLDEMGTIDYVGEAVADLASPLLVALLLCFIGAIVSAFASSTAVLGSLIPWPCRSHRPGPASARSGSSPRWPCPRPSWMSARSPPTAPWCWPTPPPASTRTASSGSWWPTAPW
jgi:hypothetical protein